MRIPDAAALLADATAFYAPADFIHKLKLEQKELKESRVSLLFESRLAPSPTVDALRTRIGC